MEYKSPVSCQLEVTMTEKNRFILRKEIFGGILFDKKELRIHCLGPAAFSKLKKKRNVKYVGLKEDATSILSSPIFVYWDITKKCNLNCKHCYGSLGKAKEKELDPKICKKIIDELYKENIFEIYFTGGEPFLKENFFEIASYAKSKGFALVVNTNGTLITEEIAKKCKDIFDLVIVSVDSVDKEKHDEFRGKENTFVKAAMGLKFLKNNGMKTGIFSVISKFNFKEIPQLTEMGSKLGVDRMQFARIVPLGKGKKLKGCYLDQSEIKKVKNKIKEAKRNKGLDLMVDKGLQSDKTKACGAGRIFFTITPSGLVTPCPVVKEEIGDLKEMSVREIWKKRFKEARKNQNLNYCSFPEKCACGCGYEKIQKNP